ncbi:TPA: divalent-cation tolerance protein CutA [Candidatus Beckwithbacteria bacterium]|nr:divalent-cation tolerance protein CutA [Candidatus Beckwithbacteria bacterium]
MAQMVLAYITCESVKQAKVIGRHLLNKKLTGCVNIFPTMQPMFLWPPKSGKIDESKEVVLLVKTLKSRYKAVEKEVIKMHTFDTPCVLEIPVGRVAKKDFDWIKGEVK